MYFQNLYDKNISIKIYKNKNTRTINYRSIKLRKFIVSTESSEEDRVRSTGTNSPSKSIEFVDEDTSTLKMLLPDKRVLNNVCVPTFFDFSLVIIVHNPCIK